MVHQVYVLYSRFLDRFYVGSTSDLEIRMEFHCTSPGHKFTGKAKDSNSEYFFRSFSAWKS
ncbi:GIY-YIG nuclease family protein [Salinimicrobium sp. WS361]|uniref:GIY-YIG nuclease family protein n=1 Tax=Salinimicrobium sp. WS361 TaxID=3425123 RepID=UPI003D6F0CCB